MTIKDVMLITGISKQNIRFYEKEGLLAPDSNRQNGYREYTNEDVDRLNEIKLYRKLDISLSDIKAIITGEMKLDDCMTKYSDFITMRMKQLDHARKMCDEVKEEYAHYGRINVPEKLEKIERLESEGERFANIMTDFITKAKGCMSGYFPKAVFFFEPHEPIMTKEDFTKELKRYGEQNDMKLEMVSESMAPIFVADDVVYMAQLELPRIGLTRLPIYVGYAQTLGFKFVYIYKYADINR